MNKKEISERFLSLFGETSRDDLAKILGTQVTAISDWKAGRKSVPWKNLEYAVENMGVTWNWLLTGVDGATWKGAKPHADAQDAAPPNAEELRFILDLQGALADVLQSLSVVGRDIASGRSLRGHAGLPSLIHTLRVAASTGQAAADALEGRPPQPKTHDRTA